MELWLVAFAFPPFFVVVIAQNRNYTRTTFILMAFDDYVFNIKQVLQHRQVSWQKWLKSELVCIHRSGLRVQAYKQSVIAASHNSFSFLRPIHKPGKQKLVNKSYFWTMSETRVLLSLWLSVTTLTSIWLEWISNLPKWFKQSHFNQSLVLLGCNRPFSQQPQWHKIAGSHRFNYLN